MYINNNHLANQLYIPYTKQLRGVAQAARRLATGEKIPTVADGGSEIGVADRYQRTVRGNNKLSQGVQAASHFVAMRGHLLEQASQILQRMSELAASAMDATKNTNDRINLNTEYQALAGEFAQVRKRDYNELSIFDNLLEIFDMDEASATISLISVNFNTTFTAVLLNASANKALTSVSTKMNSINRHKAQAGFDSNALKRAFDVSTSYQNELGNAENLIRGIDIAKAAGDFTKKQVILNAGQSILAQANGLIQNALQFIK